MIPRLEALEDRTLLTILQFGTSSNDEARALSVDASGVYVAGYTEGTLPGQSSAGGIDAYVRKYDANGNVLWTRQFGSPAEDRAWALRVDATGVYVAGYTEGTLPGQSSAGAFDAYVRKYDANGNVLWTRQFGSPCVGCGFDDYVFDLSVDATGVYVAGFTQGILPGQSNAGGADAFVRKYDASGT